MVFDKAQDYNLKLTVFLANSENTWQPKNFMV